MDSSWPGRRVALREVEWKAVLELLDQVLVEPESLAAGITCKSERLRRLMDECGINTYILLYPNQESNIMAKGGLAYWGEHLICPKANDFTAVLANTRDEIYQYVSEDHDYQSCPVKAECLPPNQKHRYGTPSMYYPSHLRDIQRNQTPDFQRDMKCCRTTAEETFASLERLS